MIEGLVGLIEAFVSAITALVSAVLHVVAAVLESLGFAVENLATSPKSGEPRFSVKRLAIAFAPLVFLLIAIPSMFWFASWRAEVNQAKRNQTKTIVAGVADELSIAIGGDGRFERKQNFDAVDAWGHKLVLEYSNSDLTETLLIRSLGVDGKPRTYDDIVEKRRNVLPIPDVAGSIMRRIKDGITKPDQGK